MAELVDAADSKSAVRKDVQVRFLFWARDQAEVLHFGFFYDHIRKDVSRLISGFWAQSEVEKLRLFYDHIRKDLPLFQPGFHAQAPIRTGLYH